MNVFFKNFYFQTLLNLIIFKFSNSMIVIPVEKLSEENYYYRNQTIHSFIIQKYFLKDIYGFFEIGTPSQKIPLFLRTNQYNFEITSSIFEKEISYFYKYNLTKFSELYPSFNEENSKTFKTQGCKNEIISFLDHKKNCDSNDTFLVYQNIDLKLKKKFENINFTLIKNKRDNISGEIGLGLVDINYSSQKHFLTILKNEKIIDNYNWFFSFENWNDTKGKLIIGSLPHENDKDKYNEKNIIYKNIFIEESSSKTWKLDFDKIYINSTNNINSCIIYLNNKIAELIFDSDIIIGTNELEQKLNDNFLKNFTEQKICFKEQYTQLYYQRFEGNFYYCNIEYKDILYEFLPSINFVSIDYNYTFEIPKEQLFKIEKKYIYLSILFPISTKQEKFVLGNLITLKYPFVFNSEFGTIGLYTGFPNESQNKEKIKRNSFLDNVKKIIIIIFLSVFLIIIGIFLGKKIYGIKRKKKANELLDDYDYNTQENNVKEKNIN